ncbi:MAG: DciA family protein [Vicinamibacterales bacterium]
MIHFPAMVPVQHCAPAMVADLLQRQPLSDAKVRFVWRLAAGAGLARVTDVRLDAQGTLRVDTSDPHWAREVERNAALLTARLTALLGDTAVRRLTVEARSR